MNVRGQEHGKVVFRLDDHPRGLTNITAARRRRAEAAAQGQLALQEDPITGAQHGNGVAEPDAAERLKVFRADPCTEIHHLRATNCNLSGSDADPCDALKFYPTLFG